MEKENNNKAIWIIAIIILVIGLMIFLPKLIENKKELENLQNEGQLIEQGKNISDVEVIEEIISILKNRNDEELKQYCSSNFEYWRERREKSNKFFLERFTIYHRE